MAATGTPTPNLGLRIPVGTDPASVDDINYNSNVLDTKIGAVGNTSVKAQIDALDTKITNYMKYKPNDTFSGKSNTPFSIPGYVTGGSQDLYFTLMVPYSMENITSVAFTGTFNGAFRSIVGYLPNSQSGNIDLRTLSGTTWTLTKLNNYNIQINVHFDSQLSVSNNTPVIMALNTFTLTFT